MFSASRNFLTKAFTMSRSAAIAAAAKGVNDAIFCGGELQPKAPIKLISFDETAVGKSNALLLSLPATEAEIPDLLGLCQEASFGRGSEAVLDPDYRSALCLSPTSFSTTFSLEQYGILSTIKTLMMPRSNGALTAELYKLNVYRPGDFFKSHVDTPRGEGMFGSLVVCLPQSHAGGQLKLQAPPAREQQEQQAGHEFNWGVNSSKGVVQWAAFYSDCPHEILPVESGYRITLTYNLFLAPASDSQPALPGLSPSSMALHESLHAALLDPDFMPSGGTLGFACQHAYPHTQEELCASVPAALKGGDAALLAVAHALGLKAEVKAVHDTKQLEDFGDEDHGYGRYRDEDEDEEGGGADLDSRMRVGALAPSEASEWCDEDMSRAEVVQRLFRGSTGTAHVTWCRRPSRWALQLVQASYGNQPSVRQWYSAAAIFVEVPALPLRQARE